MRKKTAFTLTDSLYEKVEHIRRELNLKSQSEVILRALSLLELSLGRKVELKDDRETYQINSFENLRQSVSLEDKNLKDNNE